MLNIKVWSLSLASLFAISFTICVLGGLVMPGLPIRHAALETILPGFVWISPGAFALGLIESVLYGAYVGVVCVPLHNFFARRWSTPNSVI